MAGDDTVAVLNKMGGKSTAEDSTRFKARISDVFSPQKVKSPRGRGRPALRRSSGRLQQKKMTPAVSTSGRRNSLSLPEDGDTKQASRTAKPKTRMIALKRAAQKDVNSPLKPHGHDMQLEDNPKINLNESPSKNTRSRNKNPLETLVKMDADIPKQWAEEAAAATPDSRDRSSKGATLKRSSNEESESVENGRSAKRARVRDTRQTAGQASEVEGNGGNSEEVANEDMSRESREGEDTVEEESTEPTTQGKDTTLQRSSPQRDKDVTDSNTNNRPGSRADRDKDKSSTQAQKSKKAKNAAQQQLDEVEEEEKKELKERTESFKRHIVPAIRLKDCTDKWGEAGGAAYMIRARAGRARAESDRGKAVERKIEELKDAYRERRRKLKSFPTSDGVSTTRLIGAINARCEYLEKATDDLESSIIVKDIYMHLIPAAMVLLKLFLRASHIELFFSESQLRELVQLLKIATGLCRIAQEWQPRPSTLDNGIKQWVKNEIAPNLKVIEMRYNQEVARYDRMWEDKKASEILAQKQALARQNFLERVNRARLERKTRYHSTGLHAEQRQSNEMENSDPALSASQSISHHNPNRPSASSASRNMSRPELHREATVDLPPPPAIDLSEDEITALLNGLQIYLDEDRFSQILNDPQLGEILRKRDLDDLVAAAKSFSGMMASQMGLEAYWAESSLEWLRSADTDMRDNVSVAL